MPGDKSIAHRALLLAALSPPESCIRGLPDGEDVRATRAAVTALGARFRDAGETCVLTRPLDVKSRARSTIDIDCQNSGTTMRLLAGLCAGAGLPVRLFGDASLMARDMARVVEPLRALGAAVHCHHGRAPIVVDGPPRALGCTGGPETIDVPQASAQVEAALAWFTLLGARALTVRLPLPARDHTARLFQAAGLRVERPAPGVTTFFPGCPVQPLQLSIPGDISSAAFVLAAACITPEGRARVFDCGINPSRTGALTILRQMGADVDVCDPVPEPCAEPRATVQARGGRPLQPCRVPATALPALVDEVPLLAVVATQAQGTSRFCGLGELRHKESDRLKATCELLTALGGRARIEGDDLIVEGGHPLRGGAVRSHGDHRIAMAAMVAALVCEAPVTLDDVDCTAVSFPGFRAVFEPYATTPAGRAPSRKRP